MYANYEKADGDDSPDDSGGGPPPRDESPLLKVWHLLLSIAGLMAVLLGAHYSFMKATMLNILAEHERQTLALTVRAEAHASEDERRFTRIEEYDRALLARIAALEVENRLQEQEMILVRERQAEVRRKLGFADRVPP